MLSSREKVGVLPYFSFETFQKVGVRNEKCNE